MRTPQIQDRFKDEQRQKKQLVILGVLFVLLVGVVALQFGQDAAAATERTGDDNLPVASAKDSNDVATTKPLDLSANLALSEQGARGKALNGAAFESFWNLDNPFESMLEGAPPSNIRLNATLVGRKGVPDVAIINGSLSHVGDTIDGWKVLSISSREVVLRSATQSVVSVAMPLLQQDTQKTNFRVSPTAPVTSPPDQAISGS